MRWTREQCAPQERGSFRAGCQACCRCVGADRAAQGGALQGAAGEPHLRRCRESIPRGRRQLSFTFTYSSDWWRLKWLVFFFTILGWGSGFGIASAYAAQDSLCLRVVVLLGVALVRSMRSTPTRIEYSGCPHIPLARRLGGPRYRSASG